MFITRHLQSILTTLITQFPSIMITGARQVGKSTLLKYIATGHNKNYQYITFDDPLQLAQANDEPLLFMLNHTGSLILDEVQYVPNLFPVLKLSMDEQKQNGQFLLSGSQAFSLMARINESLAGRVAVLRLLGLSLREVLDIDFNQPFIPTQDYITMREKQLKPLEASGKSLWQLIHQGQMPRLYEQETNWEIYYASYVSTYLERDVRQIANINDLNEFTRFMTAVASRSGELLNYSNIAQEVGVSIETIRRWMTILQASGIIYLLQPYHHNHLKRAIKTPKLYMLDTGLMAYLTKWLTADTLQRGAKSGQFLETFVVAEMIKSFYNQGIEPPMYYYRDTNQKEIDVIIEQNGIVYPIEIKSTANPDKKMGSAFKTLKDQLPEDEIKVGVGVILNQYPKKMWLTTELVALSLTYL